MATVLVIEDDLEINELLGEYLALEDIKYLQATTGQAGIHQAMAQHPDAIVLDLMLPDIDGFEVARTLSSHRATHDIPIVILTCMCQDCDQEKGYQAGAHFFMNKPFLPDDLLAALRQAIEWKKGLAARTAAGAITMGETNTIPRAKSLNMMVTDLFERTEMNDESVGQIREMVQTLADWAGQWNQEHAEKSHLKLEYRIGVNGAANGNGSTGAVATSIGAASVEWKMTEDEPGILADAFFKAASAAAEIGGGLMGWGTSTLVSKPLAPIAPPAKWLQVLAKTGAARFEKDSKTRTVRFVRNINGNGAAVNGSSGANGVPVVEIDGMRYPTRNRDEALAAKRK